MTQVELAKKSGFAQSVISRYETGEMDLRNAALETIVALARALGCTLYELTGLEAVKGFEKAAETFKPDPEALAMWEAYNQLPEGPEKEFIRAKLLQRKPE